MIDIDAQLEKFAHTALNCALEEMQRTARGESDADFNSTVSAIKKIRKDLAGFRKKRAKAAR